ADAPQAVKQRALVDDLDEGAAELATVGGRDAAAQLVRHRLLAVADAEHRKAAVEKLLRGARAVRPMDRARPAGQDDALGLEPVERLVGAVERGDLAVDAGFAN